MQGDGGAFVATPRRPVAGDPRGAWWLTRLPPGSLQRVAEHLPGDALLTASRDDAVAGAGGASSDVLALGFVIAALAAVMAFLAFAWAVLHESRLVRLRSELVATVGHELRAPDALERLLDVAAKDGDAAVRAEARRALLALGAGRSAVTLAQAAGGKDDGK